MPRRVIRRHSRKCLPRPDVDGRTRRCWRAMPGAPQTSFFRQSPGDRLRYPCRRERSGDHPRRLFSCDFYDHATMSLLRGVLEAHDRDRFEIFAFCHTPMARREDAMHERMLGTADICRYPEPVRCRSRRDDPQPRHRRPGRPQRSHSRARGSAFSAPGGAHPAHFLARLSGLGHGAGIQFAIHGSYRDTDTSIPYFQEKLLRLPGSTMQRCGARAGEPAGIAPIMACPEDAIVFAAFNHAAKIRLPVFESWMRILSAVESAVLWLYPMGALRKRTCAPPQPNAASHQNGSFSPVSRPWPIISPSPAGRSCARHGPCNGHTTTSMRSGRVFRSIVQGYELRRPRVGKPAECGRAARTGGGRS